METKTLKKALAKAKPFVCKKSTRPVLQNVALTQDDYQLWLEATNLEVGVRLPLGHDKPLDYPVTVEWDTLTKLVNSLDETDLALTVLRTQISQDPKTAKHFTADPAYNYNLYVTGARTKVDLPGIDYLDFPAWPKEGTQYVATWPASLLDEVATRVAPSANKPDYTRPVLEHVLCEITHTGPYQNTTFVAADGYELAKLTHCVDLHSHALDKPKDLLIRATAFAPIAALAESPQDEITVSIEYGKNGQSQTPLYAIFTFPSGATATAKLDEGTFPNYEQIVPKGREKTATALTQNVLAALKPIAVFAADHDNVTQWNFASPFTIYAKSDRGEVTREVSSKFYRSGHIALDYKRMQSLLARAGELATFYVDSPEASMLILGEANWQAVLMPMHLNPR